MISYFGGFAIHEPDTRGAHRVGGVEEKVHLINFRRIRSSTTECLHAHRDWLGEFDSRLQVIEAGCLGQILPARLVLTKHAHDGGFLRGRHALGNDRAGVRASRIFECTRREGDCHARSHRQSAARRVRDLYHGWRNGGARRLDPLGLVAKQLGPQVEVLVLSVV